MILEQNDNFRNLKTGVFSNILPLKILSILEIPILFNIFFKKKNILKTKLHVFFAIYYN